MAFARIVAAHHEDKRRVCAFMAHDEALAEGHEAYEDRAACLTLTGGILDGALPWEPRSVEPTVEQATPRSPPAGRHGPAGGSSLSGKG